MVQFHDFIFFEHILNIIVFPSTSNRSVFLISFNICEEFLKFLNALSRTTDEKLPDYQTKKELIFDKQENRKMSNEETLKNLFFWNKK